MIEIWNKKFIKSPFEMKYIPSTRPEASVPPLPGFNMVFYNNFNKLGFTGLWRHGLISKLICAVCLVLVLVLFRTQDASAESTYPDLRDAHDPELQKAMDKALGSSHPEFWSGVKKKEFNVVVADVTDLKNPRVAWYNPNLMLYAASLPKIAIVLGVFVEVERGVLKLDSETRNQLIGTIRHSSNRDATAKTSDTANSMTRPAAVDSGSEKSTAKHLPGDATLCEVSPTALRPCRRLVSTTE